VANIKLALHLDDKLCKILRLLLNATVLLYKLRLLNIWCFCITLCKHCKCKNVCFFIYRILSWYTLSDGD